MLSLSKKFAAEMPNNRVNSDARKRVSFLAPFSGAGYAPRYAAGLPNKRSDVV